MCRSDEAAAMAGGCHSSSSHDAAASGTTGRQPASMEQQYVSWTAVRCAHCLLNFAYIIISWQIICCMLQTLVPVLQWIAGLGQWNITWLLLTNVGPHVSTFPYLFKIVDA